MLYEAPAKQLYSQSQALHNLAILLCCASTACWQDRFASEAIRGNAPVPDELAIDKQHATIGGMPMQKIM